MKLGIPTLCRYDMLARLIESAERGSLKPTEYVIIDNGGALAAPPPGLNVRIIKPGTNIGVAAAWNLLLEDAGDEPIVISNDDIVFNHCTFAEMADGIERVPFVEGLGWALFAQSPECTRRVGYYDENFWPAYYEDCDYDHRMRLAGLVPVPVLSERVQHAGWASSVGVGGGVETEWLSRGKQYFLQKWGDDASHIRGTSATLLYRTPFNGTPPTGWSLRKPKAPPPPLMRWDVLNAIAQRISATRYLEIGVSNGECMRRIRVEHKWGVDPNPQVEAVKAADFFVAKTSLEFFELNQEDLWEQRFDLIFIDGHHEAEQVFLEVEQALACLRPNGVIVLHDCNPTTEAMQDMTNPHGEWTGDVWKTVVRIRQLGQWGALRVVDADYGIGILVPHAPSQYAPPVSVPHLSWSQLQSDRDGLLGIVKADAWEDWFAIAYSARRNHG